MKEPLINCKGPIEVEWNRGGREYQEDYFGVFGKDNRTLLVVADGMGGHSRGDLASQWVVESLIDIFKEKKDAEEVLEKGIQRAMEKIRQSGKDMGCTFAAAVIEKKEGKYKLSYTWVGDSRLYLINGPDKPSDNAKKISKTNDKCLWILTDDDSFVWGFYLNNELTIDQITQHPNKNQLEMSLHPRQENAADIVKKRIRSLYLKENDQLFLCTDGVWESYQSQADIMMHINTPNPGKAMQNHLEKAVQNEISTDNGTFILAEIKEEIFHQQCFPQKKSKLLKGLKRKINSFYAALIAIIFFALIFLILDGKLGPIFEKFKNEKSETGKVERVEKKAGENSREPKENPGKALQQPQVKTVVSQNKSEKKGTHKGYYSIQVGAFREVANANKTCEKYRKMNYPARVIPPGNYKNNKYYLVMVGEFRDKNASEEEKKKLEKKEKKKFLLKDSRGNDMENMEKK